MLFWDFLVLDILTHLSRVALCLVNIFVPKQRKRKKKKVFVLGVPLRIHISGCHHTCIKKKLVELLSSLWCECLYNFFILSNHGELLQLKIVCWNQVSWPNDCLWKNYGTFACVSVWASATTLQSTQCV